MRLCFIFFCISLHLITINLFAQPQKSKSGHGQENWVIEEVFNHKKGGYFVDLAAADGLMQSNTYRLETEFAWQGICIEANPFTFEKLKKNRNCILIKECIDATNREVQFVAMGLIGGILADDTRVNFEDKNRKEIMKQALKDGLIIIVYTKTLEQVLDEAQAPSIIDYLSLDVEGAELRVLKYFPFEKYVFLTMSIEKPGEELHAILLNNGYIFIKRVGLDSLYIHESIQNLLKEID